MGGWVLLPQWHNYVSLAFWEDRLMLALLRTDFPCIRPTPRFSWEQVLKLIAGINLRTHATNHELRPIVTQQVFTADKLPSFLALPFCCSWQKWQGFIRTRFLSPCLHLGRLCLQSHCPWPASLLGEPDSGLQTHVCCFVALPLGYFLASKALPSTKRTSFLLGAASANNQIGNAGMFQEH